MSNSAMQTPQDLEARLSELEIRISFTDDLVDGLNRTVFRQQEQIDLLMRDVSQLRRQVPPAGAGGPSNPGDELPPHY